MEENLLKISIRPQQETSWHMPCLNVKGLITKLCSQCMMNLLLKSLMASGLLKSSVKSCVCHPIGEIIVQLAPKAGGDRGIENSKDELIGKTVIVYDRYHFAVPVRGMITDVSGHDGAYQVTFFSNNPGAHNVTKFNGRYFLVEQCRIVEEK